MKIDYRRDARSHYLVLAEGREISEEDYTVRMVRENQIEGFLPCRVEFVDDGERFLYEVTSRQPLSEVTLENGVTARILRALLNALRMAFQQVEAYLLPPDGIVLDPECIFADFGCSRIRLCYYPANEKCLEDSLKELSGFLLPRLANGDREAVVLGYAFYQNCARSAITVESIEEMLYSMPREGNSREIGTPAAAHGGRKSPADPGSIAASDGSRHSRPDPGSTGGGPRQLSPEERDLLLDDFFRGDPAEEKNGRKPGTRILLAGAVTGAGTAAAGAAFGLFLPGCCAGLIVFLCAVLVFRKRKDPAERQRKDREDDDFWKDWEAEPAPPAAVSVPAPSPAAGADPADLADDWTDGATMYLDESMAPGYGDGSARLVPEDPAAFRTVMLGKKTMRIGKNPLVSEICLRHAAVSRMHARLEWNGNTHVLTDLRSKNGTYLNDEILEAGREYELCDGDFIRFADAGFRYGQT